METIKKEPYFCPETGAHFHIDHLCSKLEAILHRTNELVLPQINATFKNDVLVQNDNNEKFRIRVQPKVSRKSKADVIARLRSPKNDPPDPAN